jgi:cytochrome c-type biogenesis protein CcmH
METRGIALWILVLAICGAAGCDSNVERFVPGEKPEQPDLSKIFPPGAERAAESAGSASQAGMRGTGPRGAPPVASSQEPIRGTVSLAAELADRVPPDAVLFLMARLGGAGPPVAVQRIPSPQFPLAFAIGPADWMADNVPFAGPLGLTARLDRDGDATTRTAGDLQGAAQGNYAPGDSGVALVIDELL